MTVTLEKFKQYMRIDVDFEDVLLQQFIATARHYLIGAISNFESNYQNSEIFADKADLLQMIVAAEFYQNRANSKHDLSYTVNSLMRQLQYWCSADSDVTLTEVPP